MAIPGLISISFSLIAWILLVDSPSEVGIDINCEGPKEQGTQLTLWEVLIKYVAKNTALWLICLSCFCQTIIKTAVADWGVLYLVKSKGFSTIDAGYCMMCY